MGNELSINGVNFKLEDLPSEIKLAELENEGMKKYLSVYDVDKVKGTLSKAELKSAIFDIYKKEKAMSGKKSDTNIDEYEAEYIARQYGLEGKNVSDAVNYLKDKIRHNVNKRAEKEYFESLVKQGIVIESARKGVYKVGQNSEGYVCNIGKGSRHVYNSTGDSCFAFTPYTKNITFFEDKVSRVESSKFYDSNIGQVVVRHTIYFEKNDDSPYHYVTKINDDGSCEAKNIFDMDRFTGTVILDKNDNIQALKPQIKQAQENFTPENILPEQVGQKQFNLTKDYSKLGFNSQNYKMYDGTRFVWNEKENRFDRVKDQNVIK